MIERGEPFGKYELLERIALGGMAEIFRAKTGGIEGFERTVAIKRLHRHLCHDQELVQMLLDEARLAVQLQHANIAQVFDLGKFDDQYFIVMEYIPGSDMHRVLRRVKELGRAVPTPIILYAVTEMLAGLDYAHNLKGQDGSPLNVVHRDISPQNIMFSMNGEVKLIDFGIAKANMQMMQTQAGIIKGKFYYMSPEQAHGQKLDRRSDVFAAGMVLYELLTGRPAYEEVQDIELLKSVRACRFKPPSHWRKSLDPKLVEIIMRALHKDKRQRYQSARELQEALLHYMKLARMNVTKFQAAEFLESVIVMEETVAGGERPAVMGRDEFSADESSLIFRPGDKLIIPPPSRPQDVTEKPISFAPSLGSMDENPFADSEEATFVYTGPSQQQVNPFAIPDEVHMTHSGHVSWTGRHEEEALEELPSSEFDTLLPEPVPQKIPHPAGGLVLPEDPQVAIPTTTSPEGYGQLVKPSQGTYEATATPHFDTSPPPSTPKEKALFYLEHLTSPKHRIKVGVIALLLLLFCAGMVFALDGKKTDSATVPIEPVVDNTSLSADPLDVKTPVSINLRVSSSPKGALLYRDGIAFGKTPVTLKELTPKKKYTLTLEKEGFEKWEKELEFGLDASPLQVSLQKKVDPGIIDVVSTPKGLEVRLNGKTQSSCITGCQLNGLDRTQSYLIQVVKKESDGSLLMRERKVSWSSGDDARKVVRVTFEEGSSEPVAQVTKKEPKKVRKPPKRVVKKNTRRDKKSSNISVWPKGSKKPKKTEKAQKGDGFNVWGDKSKPKKNTLPSPKKGYLTVKVSQVPVKVSVDGKVVSNSSGFSKRPISPGSHRVVVTFKKSGKSSSRVVFIKPGINKSVIFRP